MSKQANIKTTIREWKKLGINCRMGWEQIRTAKGKLLTMQRVIFNGAKYKFSEFEAMFPYAATPSN